MDTTPTAPAVEQPDHASLVADTQQAAVVAEREAAEAGDLVQVLENRVRHGDQDVKPADIAGQRDLAHFAQLRAEATRRKAEQARQTARLARLAVVADEIRARHSDATRLAELMADLEDVAVTLVRTCENRAASINTWREAMHRENVPAGPCPTDAGHGEAGWDDQVNGGVRLNGRHIIPADPAQLLAAVLVRVVDATRRTDLAPTKLPAPAVALIADPAAFLERYL